MNENELIGVSRSSRILECCHQTVHNWWKAGKISGFKTGDGVLLLSKSDVERVKASMSNPPRPGRPKKQDL